MEQRHARRAARQPNFLLLGAPKSGTTALSHYLASHPDVFLSQPKEPHFFDGAYDKGMEAYVREHFAEWTHEQVAGEATPSYLAVPYVPARIGTELPDARLIALLRHPVERAYSSWWMLHARGMEPLSFATAVADNLARLDDDFARGNEQGEQAWRAHVAALRRGDPIRLRTYLDTGYYARHLQRYYEHFPSSQLKIILSDDLQRRPEDVVRDLWRWLGVRDDIDVPRLGAINEALGSGARPLIWLLRSTGGMRFRSLLPDVWLTRGKKWLSLLGRRPELAPTLRERLLEHFAPHTRELEALLEIDLTAWKQ
ncbi:sulfotransferase [soil metagenome]